MTTEQPSLREWHPLEASPEVFTKMARVWGVSEQYTFHDILSLDSEFLGYIPRPVHAVILLFPDTPEIVAFRTGEDAYLPNGVGEDVVWIPQVDVGHACGTFALVHALGVTGLAPGLNGFFKACQAVPPGARTKLFATNPLIHSAHHSAIAAGQTEPRLSDWDDCDHFLSFAHSSINGEKHVVELDGTSSRKGVLDRGLSGDGDLLVDVAKIVKKVYLPRAGDNVHFSMIALCG